MNMKLYSGLLLLTVAAAICGVLTLIPAGAASYPSAMGYRSLCTFAPASSFFCFFVAGSSCIVRAGLVKRRAMAGGKSMVRAKPVAAVTIVLVAAILSTVWFTSVKSSYTDATSQATRVENGN